MVRDPLALRLLRCFRATTAKSQLLSTHRSLSAYNRWIATASAAFGLADHGWTGHRRWASDAVIRDIALTTICEAGRWQCDKTLRRYLDVIAVMGGEAAGRLAPFLNLVEDIESRFDDFFQWWTS